MNIRLRSAQSRRDAVRKGLIGYLGESGQRHDMAAEDANAGPHAHLQTAGEHLPAADAQSATAPPAVAPTT